MTHDQPNTQNYRILGVARDAGLEELKTAYHRVAKKIHPDLAPPGEKRRAELRMMRVNEAYMAIIAERMRDVPTGASTGDAEGPTGASTRDAEGPERDATSAAPRAGATSRPDVARATAPARAVARPRDPGYTYYKLGFDFYRKGYTEFYSKDPRIIRKQLAELKTYDYYLLTLTVSALRHFEKSYRYFAAVLEQAPDSIWATDARAKLRKVEKFNRIYQRICENLSRSVHAKRAERATAPDARNHARASGTDGNTQSETAG
ncbi:MAG: DnaJ domain-containing protein [Spirochaetes bacterium]|jgi:hypothetical protein|nr:DnaJ domain-containing protein [Spirochaetota bacterium]